MFYSWTWKVRGVYNTQFNRTQGYHCRNRTCVDLKQFKWLLSQIIEFLLCREYVNAGISAEEMQESYWNHFMQMPGKSGLMECWTWKRIQMYHSVKSSSGRSEDGTFRVDGRTGKIYVLLGFDVRNLIKFVFGRWGFGSWEICCWANDFYSKNVPLDVFEIPWN